jgi:hypothetical protein
VGAARHAARELVGLETRGAGAVEVASTEAETSVLLDGAAKGKAPFAAGGLKAGRHAVRAVKPGFFDFQSELYVFEDEKTTVRARLQERPRPWTKVTGIVGASVGAVALLFGGYELLQGRSDTTAANQAFTANGGYYKQADLAVLASGQQATKRGTVAAPIGAALVAVSALLYFAF